MSLKYRFALLFSFFVYIILMLSFSSIYYLGEDFRKEDFTKQLRANALHEFQHYQGGKFAQASQANDVLNLPEEHITIFTQTLELVHTNPPISSISIDKKLFAAARKKGEVVFHSKEKQGIVLYRQLNNSGYFILSSAFDLYGKRKINNLRYILIITLLGGLILSALFAFFFVRQVMKPVNELKEQMQHITENNLDARLGIKDGVEFGGIALAFNNMLDRLRKAFELQRNFVQHASHELRTPLASMLTQTESALRKDLSVAEYKQVLHSLREDQINMTHLTNSLLLLSQFETGHFSAEWQSLRVDEILYDLIEKFKVAHADANIELNFSSVPENGNCLNITGNDTLITTVFFNLIKNAYIFSTDKALSITINPREEGVELFFENKGEPLTQHEKEGVFIPFVRGENATNVKGKGLGLSLVQRIMNLHNGSISYSALDGNINRFTLRIPA